jgi:tetratricopeptide (TPR) repeat protein
MASLNTLQQDSSRLVLGKGGGNVIGSLIGIIVFGIVSCVGLASLAESDGEFNPVALVIFIVIGLAGLLTLRNALSSTRVVVDSSQRIASRTDSFLFIPFRSKHIAFNQIRDVQLANPLTGGALSLDSVPAWQVSLAGSDGTSLLLNDRGTRYEMQELASQVSALVARPVRGAGDSTDVQRTSSAPASAGGLFGSLVENLTVFAESLGEGSSSTYAPPFSAYPSSSSADDSDISSRPSPDSPYAQASARMAQKQVAAGASSVAASARMAQDRADAFASDAAAYAALGDQRASAFESDVQAQKDLAAQQLAAAVPFTEASARLAQQQAEAQSAMGFSMPGVLTMPQLPPLATFGPALDMPSFAPIGMALSLLPPPPPETPETKVVELQDTSAPRDNALLRQARQFLNVRNFREAQDTYLRALKLNPADSVATNELGVVYYLQNRLQEAERTFRRSLALDPFVSEPRYNLGLVLQRLGRRREAQEEFRVGLQQASRQSVGQFQDALRGILHDPMTASR